MFNNMGRGEIVLVHIPKNAGTSVYEGLRKAVAGSQWSLYPDNNHWTPGKWKASIGAGRFAAALKILVLRDPFGRAVSIYEHGRKHGRYQESFSEFAGNLPRYITAAKKVEILPQANWWVADSRTFYMNFTMIQRDWGELLRCLGVEFRALEFLNRGGYLGPRGYYYGEGNAAENVHNAYSMDFKIWYDLIGAYKP